jgi:hypothetical protein
MMNWFVFRGGPQQVRHAGRTDPAHTMKLTLFIFAFMMQTVAAQQPTAAQHPLIAKRPAYVSTNIPILPGLQPVTGEQVEEFLADPKTKRDGALAKRLDSVILTERFSADRLARCEKETPGPKSKQALIALADRSAFNPQAAEEILSLAEPSVDDQRKMMTLTADYVVNTLHRLPDFYATRVTRRYGLEGDTQSALVRAARIDSVIVYYRNGDEEVSAAKRSSKEQGMTTRGEFGPVLALAVLDAAKGNLAWSRWELGPTGPRAVYTYAAKAADSHYEVGSKRVAYIGEIMVDPESGAILRLILKADPDAEDQTSVSDIEVDYGPVDLGGQSYLCPIKSIALSEQFGQVSLNDVVFEDYHLFHGEVKVLPGFTEMK